MAVGWRLLRRVWRTNMHPDLNVNGKKRVLSSRGSLVRNKAIKSCCLWTGATLKNRELQVHGEEKICLQDSFNVSDAAELHFLAAAETVIMSCTKAEVQGQKQFSWLPTDLPRIASHWFEVVFGFFVFLFFSLLISNSKQTKPGQVSLAKTTHCSRSQQQSWHFSASVAVCVCI